MRFKFLDALRGLAIVLMVFNHTARWWLSEGAVGFAHPIIYFTVTLSAPIFLFLVGFCLSLSFSAAKETKNFSDRKIIFKYLRRGVLIILAGYIFNLIVFTTDSILQGRVLQSIGISIIIALPFLYLSRVRYVKICLLALSLAIFFSFGLWSDFFAGLSVHHPIIVDLFFSDFPLFPWFGFVLTGLVLGRFFLELAARNSRWPYVFSAALGFIGALCLVVVLLFWQFFGKVHFFYFTHDYNLNGYWSPKGITVFWIFGAIFLLFLLFYFLFEVKKVRLRSLVILGQASLMLYFAHHLIGFDLLAVWGGFRMSWLITYVLSVVVFLAVLIGLGWGWKKIKLIIVKRKAINSLSVL